MELLANLFQFGVVILCLIGLSLPGKRYLPQVDYALHFCFSPLILVAVLFFVEHFIGLGQMPFLWIPGSILSLWLIQKEGWRLLREPVLWYFFFGFAVCFVWRYCFPDIEPNSERIADHAHLVSYSAGTRLPAEDIWLKGSPDDMYYIFQFYATGLLHRWMGASSGLTYHMGYCVLTGLSIAAIGAGIRAMAQSTWAGTMAVLTTALGGCGSTLLAPLIAKGGATTFGAMRFVGSFAMPGNPSLTDFGHKAIEFLGVSPVEAPMEYYAYIIMLGDFHPSLSSLLFFGLGVLAIGMAERAPVGSMTDKYCYMAAPSTAIFLLVSNTWIVPLQALLILSWQVYRVFIGKRDPFLHWVVAWVAPFILIYPFFSHFAYEARNYPIHIEWVKVFCPILDWLLLMSPAILLLLVCACKWGNSRFAVFLTIVGTASLLGTYFLYVHDIYGGDGAIFNTTLKWWPWVFAMIICFGIGVCWNRPASRAWAIFIVFLTLVGNCWTFGQALVNLPKPHMGRLDGYAWYLITERGESRGIYELVAHLPKGVLLESPIPDSVAPSITLAQFTGHYSVGGWTGHELLWRGGRIDLADMGENRDRFYRGELADPLSWLNGVAPGGVNYIVWMGYNNTMEPNNVWYKVNDAIKSEYAWRSVDQIGDTHWGVFIRKY